MVPDPRRADNGDPARSGRKEWDDENPAGTDVETDETNATPVQGPTRRECPGRGREERKSSL